jgi:single-strand DNA-binding protein
MASFNKVILCGNLTRDPQVKFTTGGTAVAEVGLAVNREWFDKSTNSKKSEVTFVDVTLWGRTAEVAGEYLRKGASVLIEGRLQLDTWDDRESGQKRSKLKVIGENMTMLGGGHRDEEPKADRQPAAQQNREPARSEPPRDNADEYGGGPPTDEVPF